MITLQNDSEFLLVIHEKGLGVGGIDTNGPRPYVGFGFDWYLDEHIKVGGTPDFRSGHLIRKKLYAWRDKQIGKHHEQDYI